MSKYSYSTTVGEKDAAAVGLSLPVSTKQCIEICTALRGKKLARAKMILNDAINQKEAIPFKRFTNGIGHKHGRMASGSYPEKACRLILKLLGSAEANAQFKGLNSSELAVRHICSQTGPKAFRYGRRRRIAKRTNVEIVLTEMQAKAEEKKAKKMPAEKTGKAAEKSPSSKKVQEKAEQ